MAKAQSSNVRLELTPNEASVLYTLLMNISGSNSFTKNMADIRLALWSAGVRRDERLKTDRIHIEQKRA